MGYNLKNRHFLSLRDFAPGEIAFLLRLSADLKAAKYAGTEREGLRGKEIALIFETDSTRTRAAFEVAAHDQGANVTFLGPAGLHLGQTETVKDAARVLGRMFDGIEYRGARQEIVEELAAHARVPVWNGLTDAFHPTQALADFLTMQEHSQKPWRDIALCFLGDLGSNVGDSLLIGGAKLGMDVRLCGPRACWPETVVEAEARSIAQETGARILITEDRAEATPAADFLYTTAWLSPDQPKEAWAERIEMLKPYQVNEGLMLGTDNPRIRFMHCLPAFHNAETEMGAEIERQFGLSEMEVTDAVFESDASIVFDQAENRLHTIKAMLVAALGD